MNEVKTEKDMSPLAVWALSVGSAIGWGSLVVTSRTYLSQAGPLGSVLGLLIGLALMIVVAFQYRFLAVRYPGKGGLYSYIKNVFGYDRAFLVSWFLFLVYISIFWANATSIPLFARYFLNSVFSFDYLYSIFGYDVYLGEALVTLVVIILVAVLCMKRRRGTLYLVTALALLFSVGITIVFIIAMAGHGKTGLSMAPAFVPDKNAIRQILRIAFISPWAFIGFESVAHCSDRFTFKTGKLFKVLVAALVVTTALYIFVILLSISAYPESCSSWLDYIRNLDNFEGIAGLPAFYAAHYYLGDAGVYILMASLLALVLTSLIGMMRAVSNICHAVALDGILPKSFAKLNSNQIPYRTILLVVVISLPIPFLGRTAIGWIVDTTTIGATIIYSFVSAAVLRVAKHENCKGTAVFSRLFLVVMTVFLLFLLFPSIFSDHTIETETYALITVWLVLGLVFFNWIIRKDHARNFGKAIIVWIALLAFIVIVAMAWADRSNETKENQIIAEINSYMEGTAENEFQSMSRKQFLDVQLKRLHKADNASVMVIGGLFGLSLVVMLINYLSMKKWGEEDRIAAFTDKLTGVRSKNAFSLEETEMERKIASGNAEGFAVIVCDVNNLKIINDTLGHKAGDEYIMDASDLLCENYKHSPVFRIGGDEFVVLIHGRDYNNREALFEKINAEIEGNLASGKVVASLGMAVYDPETDLSFHDVFKRADRLMYDRKLQLKEMGVHIRD